MNEIFSRTINPGTRPGLFRLRQGAYDFLGSYPEVLHLLGISGRRYLDLLAWFADDRLQPLPAIEPNPKGYAWASNDYLAKLYNSSKRSVCRWLAELETAGFIEIEPAANQYGQRKIFISDSAVPKMAG
jgi:hypothetical protein